MSHWMTMAGQANVGHSDADRSRAQVISIGRLIDMPGGRITLEGAQAAVEPLTERTQTASSRAVPGSPQQLRCRVDLSDPGVDLGYRVLQRQLDSAGGGRFDVVARPVCECGGGGRPGPLRTFE